MDRSVSTSVSSSVSTSVSLNDMPTEILQLIFMHAAASQNVVLSMALTCKKWKSIVENNYQIIKNITFECINSEELCSLMKAPLYKFIHKLDLMDCVNLTDNECFTIAKQYHHSLKSLLIINHCYTNIGIIEIVSKCENLQILSITDCDFLTDYENNIIMQNCRHLKILNLSNSIKITGEGFTLPLSMCAPNHLQSLILLNCKNIMGNGLIAIARSCRNLQHLDLSNCQNITDDGLIAISENCYNLTLLNLWWCKKITDDGLIAIVRSCKFLQLLDLSGCEQITNIGFIAISQYCYNIHTLSFDKCEKITNNGIEAIAKSCKKLTELRASNITKNSLIAIASCDDLEHLQLIACNDLTDEIVLLYVTKFKNFKSINIIQCNNITNATIDAITNNCKFLKSIILLSCSGLTNCRKTLNEHYNSASLTCEIVA
jgi:hypothetical protein